MKLGFRFFVTLAGLAVFAAQTPAANMDMLSVSGDARTRFNAIDNNGLADIDIQEGYESRVRLNLDVAPTASLKVRLTPQFTHNWGTQAPANGAFTAHEAWMAWMPSETVGLYIGRQVLHYGNGVIIGKEDWTNITRNFDAARAVFKYNMGQTDVLWAKVADRTVAFDADHDLLGLYTTLNMSENVPALKAVDVYVFYNDDREVGAKERFATFGTRIAGDAEMVDWNFEVTGQFGKAAAFTGSNDMFKGVQVEGEAGVKLGGSFRTALQGIYANTEFVNIAPETHEYLGHADILGRNNIISIALLNELQMGEMFKASLDGYYFMRASTSAAARAEDGRTAVGGATTKRPLGMEGDLVLSFMPEKMLNFDLGVALFKGIGDLGTGSKVMTKTYIQGELTF